MLMIYGLFVFSTQSAPFNELEHSVDYRWASNDRVGRHPAYQYLGKGEDSMTINGTLMPEFSGGPLSLALLRMLADSGKAYLLMSGNGKIYGYYFIENINETGSHFLKNGTPQKIEFTVSLKRYDGGLGGVIGSIAPFIPAINQVF